MKTENKDGKTLRYTNAGEPPSPPVPSCTSAAAWASPRSAIRRRDWHHRHDRWGVQILANRFREQSSRRRRLPPRGKSSDDGTGLLFAAGTDTKLAGHLDEAADDGAEEVSVRLAEESAGIADAAAAAGEASATAAVGDAITAELEPSGDITAAISAAVAGAGNMRLVDAPVAANSTGVKGDVAIDDVHLPCAPAPTRGSRPRWAFDTWT